MRPWDGRLSHAPFCAATSDALRLLSQPIGNSELRHFLEILKISSEQLGIIGSHDARDFQIHRSDASLGGFQSGKLCRRRGRPVKDVPSCKELEKLSQLRIGVDLPKRIGRSTNCCQPAS
jgi:hypothetical protein